MPACFAELPCLPLDSGSKPEIVEHRRAQPHGHIAEGTQRLLGEVLGIFQVASELVCGSGPKFLQAPQLHS